MKQTLLLLRRVLTLILTLILTITLHAEPSSEGPPQPKTPSVGGLRISIKERMKQQQQNPDGQNNHNQNQKENGFRETVISKSGSSSAASKTDSYYPMPNQTYTEFEI
jgi:hypothetical protein